MIRFVMNWLRHDDDARPQHAREGTPERYELERRRLDELEREQRNLDVYVQALQRQANMMREMRERGH